MALQAWSKIEQALAASPMAEDRQLAADIRGFIERQPVVQELRKLQKLQKPEVVPPRDRPGPEMVR